MTTATTPTMLVTDDWLAHHADDPRIRVIEVEGMGEGTYENYLDAHVPGAVFWPWKERLWDEVERDFPAPDRFAERLGAAGIGNDSILVFYSRDPQFGTYGWWVTRYCGHDHSHVLDGGIQHWRKAGRPVEKGPGPSHPPERYQPVANRREDMRVRRDTVLQHLHVPGTQLIDARTPEEYRGEVVSPRGKGGAVRRGRIPGAIGLPYFSLLDETHRFLPTDQLQAIVSAHGISSANQLFTYCRLGHRASLMYFVLHELLGFPGVRSYDGSWIEWGNLVGAPIER